VLVRAEALRSQGADDVSFCELDGDLQPWDKNGRSKQPHGPLRFCRSLGVWGLRDGKPAAAAGLSRIANTASLAVTALQYELESRATDGIGPILHPRSLEVRMEKVSRIRTISHYASPIHLAGLSPTQTCVSEIPSQSERALFRWRNSNDNKAYRNRGE
jgi:hypothetical protein